MFGRLEGSVSPLRLYFILWNIIATFYVSHFEKYLTKVLFLPWGYDASQVVSLGGIFTGVGFYVIVMSN